MASKVLNKEAVGLGGDDELTRGLLDREPGSKLLDVAASGGGCRLNLRLGSGDDLGLLLFDVGAKALRFLGAVRLSLRTHRCDLIVELREARLDRVQPGASLFGRGARIDELLLNGGVARAEGLREGLAQDVANADGQDQEVEDGEAGRGLLSVKAHHGAKLLNGRRVTVLVILVLDLFLLLGDGVDGGFTLAAAGCGLLRTGGILRENRRRARKHEREQSEERPATDAGGKGTRCH